MIDRMMIVGASRGIGAAIAAHYAPSVRKLISVSRTSARHGVWRPCDVSQPDQIQSLAEWLGDAPLDALMFLGGVWESGAFTDTYSFETSTPDEARTVLMVNLLAPILLVHALLPNLKQSDNPRVVLIGSLSGLDHAATKEVANSASKYGLRGAAQALAISLRDLGVAVTVVNPGNVATAEVMDDIAAGRFGEQVPIPIKDLAAAIDCALAMSPASVISEINIAQRRPDMRA